MAVWGIHDQKDKSLDSLYQLLCHQGFIVSTPLTTEFSIFILSIVFTSAYTTPKERPAASCQRWNVSGTWSISQSNGFSITFIVQQKQDGLTGTADNGSGPVPVVGTMHNNQLAMTVSWASGGAGRYTATMIPSGLLTEGFTQNLSMPSWTATWNTTEQFKCANSAR